MASFMPLIGIKIQMPTYTKIDSEVKVIGIKLPCMQFLRNIIPKEKSGLIIVPIIIIVMIIIITIIVVVIIISIFI